MEGNVGRTWLAFRITLSASASKDVTLTWKTANGTAIAGRDYLPVTSKVVIKAGQTTGSVGVWVVGDRFTEANETFFVQLTSAVNATLSSTARRGTGQIFNDDGISRAALVAAFASLEAFNTKARK